MSEVLDTHRETVLESPYSRDREEAIEELGRLFPEVGDDDKRRVLETLRQVASEATSSRERERALDAMLESFDADPDVATSVVVPCFCDLAADGKHRDERLDAIDALKKIYPAVDDPNQERIGKRLAEIAGNATYDNVRNRARQRLSDVTAENEQAAPADSEGGDAVGYLGRHLQNTLRMQQRSRQRHAYSGSRNFRSSLLRIQSTTRNTMSFAKRPLISKTS
jgi:hypothetical protein